jgi:hypothetical protein
MLEAKPDVLVLAGQMDVYECIEVAAAGSDGFPRDSPSEARSPLQSPGRGSTALVDRPSVGAAGASSEGSQGPTGAVLDLHKGIVELTPPEGCPRWPADFLLRWELGEVSGYVRGRCHATNLCRYCQALYVQETVEMLKLDASEYAPTVWMVLTAREHLTRADLRGHLEALRRVTRKGWPEIEWFVQVEFQRRGALHANLLIKGVPVEERLELEGVASARWCDRVDAEPVGQWSGAVQDGVGTILYISKMLAHGLKAEQAPPIGWKGHRTSQTRGYLVRPASVMRAEAKESLRRRRTLYRIGQERPELPAEDVDELVTWKLERDSQRWWVPLYARDPDQADDLVQRTPITREHEECVVQPAGHDLERPPQPPRTPVQPTGSAL